MSILVKGKQLPKSCWECWEWRNVDTGIYCALLRKNLRIGDGHPGKERKEWCPLIEIPKHGRLIDADALEQEAQKRLLMCEKNDNQFQKPYEVVRAIALAPTVIPPSDKDINVLDKEEGET